ncbi:hypothetical protein TNIN_163331 [Trichonephila inaurata madagascariensis]|uniref:Uncharacterized protein n=1 Tax=Trichonephila inaurata madagascariensis TaxID=2747483 RepID=A0A8X6J7L6_9ARAC|nr:hypothetical protein TNIN_163331 [Trichonephila inaurata madagascariensis]
MKKTRCYKEHGIGFGKQSLIQSANVDLTGDLSGLRSRPHVVGRVNTREGNGVTFLILGTRGSASDKLRPRGFSLRMQEDAGKQRSQQRPIERSESDPTTFAVERTPRGQGFLDLLSEDSSSASLTT